LNTKARECGNENIHLRKSLFDDYAANSFQVRTGFPCALHEVILK